MSILEWYKQGFKVQPLSTEVLPINHHVLILLWRNILTNRIVISQIITPKPKPQESECRTNCVHW